jgi:hypothetical protein
MTDEQRKKSYGWMNAEHVTTERKREIREQSLGAWWKNATQQQKDTVIRKRCESIIKSERGHFRVYDNNLEQNHQSNIWAHWAPELDTLSLRELFEM